MIGPSDFYPVGGGEAGWVVPDPRDANIVYSDSESSVNRFDKKSEQSQDISPDPVDIPATPPASFSTGSTGPRR